MSQLLESIKIEDGVILNKNYHDDRMKRSRLEIYNSASPFSWDPIKNRLDSFSSGVYKLRILYSDKLDSFEFVPYSLKVISSLKIVEDNHIQYDLKYSNRTHINHLLSQRGECDDVLIIRDGKITDTSYCNVALWDGSIWRTPKSPLLKGTKRQQLLDTGRIEVFDIPIGKIGSFERIRLFNAMINFGELELPMSSIF